MSRRTAAAGDGEPESGTGEPTGPADRLRDQRAAVTRRLEALLRDRAGIVASATGSAVDDEHDPEGATLAFEREQLSALVAAARAELRDIDAALLRVADGSYGRCVGCGSIIPAGRLQARPGATTCVRCAAA